MNKMFVVLAAAALAGCAAPWQNESKEEESKRPPRLVTETPYGLSNLYEETSAPQLYSVIAARVTNKMLDQTTEIYEKAFPPKLYIMQIKKAGVEHIPDGFYYSRQVTRDIIKGSKTFTLVNTRDEADYHLDIIVSRLNVQNIPGNILQYKMTLFDKGGNEVGSWMESIRQVQNDDRSWW